MLVALLLAPLQAVFAQEDVVVQDLEAYLDSTVSIVAWFYKTDTLVYDSYSLEGHIEGNDTITDSSVRTRFEVCVADSTKKGYRLAFKTQEYEPSDTTSFRGKTLQLMGQSNQGAKMIVQTNEVGQPQKIENFRELKKKISDNLTVYARKMYEDNPSLYTQISQPELEKQLKKALEERYGSSEQMLEESYAGLLLLMHGQQFEVGEDDVEADGQRIHIEASKGKTGDEAYDFDDDYQLYMRIETVAPGSVQQTIHYSYSYFPDGWPKEVVITTMTPNGESRTELSQMHIVWVSKN